jgi:3-hydroxyacyl-CoA dehydrogenase
MHFAASRIQHAAVLGAGTMGAQIAAHLANAGYPVILLDLTAEAAKQGLERARKLKPDPFFVAGAVSRIRTGGFDDLSRIAQADWIIEAIIERADAKQALLERVDAVRKQGSIVSSNTSGLSIAGLAEGRSADFRRHWLGTHFFNPPRYLQLVELIPTADTDPDVVAAIAEFVDRRLGKNTVIAKDTPGFIANHVAMFGMVRIFEALASGRYTIEEIDAITGPALGRPKSATFRTADIAGLDIIVHVARDLASRLPVEHRAHFNVPPFIDEMVKRGWLGEKSGRGFYERRTSAEGETEIWTLDPHKMEYRPRQSPKLPALDAAAPLPLAERVKKLFDGNDRAGEFLRETLTPALRYTAEVSPAIAHSPDDIDRAMRWGYGWPQGPFELWDAVELDGRRTRSQPLGPAHAEFDILRSAHERQRIIASNSGASLVDLEDGVLAVSLHSKMNAIGTDALEMLERGVREAAENFQALVIGTDSQNFSVGANLMLLLFGAEEEEWDEIDAMIRQFQRTTSGLRYSPVPVIAAPHGLALGGGCEIVLHADRVQAAAETYIGLVETGVGLIPAAGGTKEMLLRSGARKAFETIGFAKASTSAVDALQYDYLRPIDAVTMNRDRVIFDAKQRALERVREGYVPPAKPQAIPVGGAATRAVLDLGVHLAWRGGRISDHDAVIGRKLSWVLSGGSLPHASHLSEDQVLDLEREAFLSLCGEPKTLERIRYTLKTGKPLRN